MWALNKVIEIEPNKLGFDVCLCFVKTLPFSLKHLCFYNKGKVFFLSKGITLQNAYKKLLHCNDYISKTGLHLVIIKVALGQQNSQI